MSLFGLDGQLITQYHDIPNIEVWIKRLETLFSGDQDIECIVTNSLMCVCHIRFNQGDLYLGPVSTIKCDSYRVKSLMNQYHIPFDTLNDAIQFFNGVGQISVNRFAEIAALAYISLTGKSIDPQELISYKYDAQPEENMVASAVEAPHNAQGMELRLFSQIMNGIPVDMAFDPEHAGAINEGTLSYSPVSHRRYLMISSVALAARYAVSGGMDYSLSMSIADNYIRLLDSTNDVEKMLKIGNDMFRTYSYMVRDIQMNHPESILAYKVQRYVTSHLDEDLSVQQLAELLGVSRSYLSTHFKTVTGKSLSDFIIEQRINQAKVLLKTTDLSISEIAARLAYSSQSYFQVAFHKAAGMTPKEYKQMQLKPFEL